MVFFNKLKSWINIFREVDKIPQYQQILDLHKKIEEMQKKIDELEIENKSLKNMADSIRNSVIINQFKKIDQRKNSCK